MLNHRLAVAVVLALGFSGAAPLAAQRPAPPADLEQLRERAEWSRRMARKGFLSPAQVREYEAQLKAAEAPAPPEKPAAAGPKWEYKTLSREEIGQKGFHGRAEQARRRRLGPGRRHAGRHPDRVRPRCEERVLFQAAQGSDRPQGRGGRASEGGRRQRGL